MEAVKRLAKLEVWIVVGVSFFMAAAVEVLTLGTVKLKTVCEICEQEIALRNIGSHMRWHVRRGEWRS